MATDTAKERKQRLYARTQELFKSSKSFVVVSMENITALQLQNTKMSWKDSAEFLFGKNTTMKKALNDMGVTEFDRFFKGNIAFIFTRDIKTLKYDIMKNKRNAFAKVGAIAQDDMWIENMITTMGPDKTSFFQALGINTKITKGKVEIISRAQTLYKGQKVTPSQANLLKVMNIKPFVFYMEILAVYENGEFYSADILDITDEDINSSLTNSIQEIAAISLGAGVLSKASASYELSNAFRDIVKVSLASGFEIKESAAFK
ncbi:60S acidic ribosomal protein P0 [Dictyocoela muelleri]|nr:60S acidic ribosomal protein P0 [Dictyocoela muelleri]